MSLGNIRYGVSPISWTNDDLPALGGDTPLEVCLSESQEIGFEGVELGGKFPREAEALKHTLAPYGLDIVSGWFSGMLKDNKSASDEIERITPHLDLLLAMDCNVVVYCDVSGSIQGVQDVSINQSPSMPSEDWPSYGERLTKVAEHVKARGLDFGYHHHMGTFIEKGHQVDSLCEHTDSVVGLTFDTGHAAMAGMDPVEAIHRYKDRICHFHCKDIRPEVVSQVRSNEMSFLNGVMEGMFTVPGDGGLDFDAILKALNDISYSGWLIIEAEQDPAKANPKIYAQQGLDHLKSILTSIQKG